MDNSPQGGGGPQQPPLPPPPRAHRSRSSADSFVYSPSSLLPIPEEEQGAEPLSLPPSAPWAEGNGAGPCQPGQAPCRDAPGAPHSDAPPDVALGIEARGSGAVLCDAASARASASTATASSSSSSSSSAWGAAGPSERGHAGGGWQEPNGAQEGEAEGEWGLPKGARTLPLPFSFSLSLPPIPPFRPQGAAAGGGPSQDERQGPRHGSCAQPSTRSQELLLQLQGAQQEMLERQQQEQQHQQRQQRQQQQEQMEQEQQWAREQGGKEAAGEMQRGLPNGAPWAEVPVSRRLARGLEPGRGPGVQRMWEGGILNCWEDSAGASQTLCCPCVTFGENMDMAGMGECPGQSLAYFGVTYGACALSQLLGLWWCHFDFFSTLGFGLFFAGTAYAAHSRTEVRKRFNIHGDESTDCLYHAFCSCCALCQENRTLKANNVFRGVWSGRGDMSSVVMGRTKSWDCMAPPPEFKMSAAADPNPLQSPRYLQGAPASAGEPLAAYLASMLQAWMSAMAALPCGVAWGAPGAEGGGGPGKGGVAGEEGGAAKSAAAEGDAASSHFPASPDLQLSPRSHPFSTSAKGLTEAPFLTE